MCGIAGLHSRSASDKEQVFNDMLSCIQHRGPDAHGIEKLSNTFLGHRRLSILDLSTSANQPMTSQSGRYTICYNGEVYNFKEIAKDLDVQLKTSGDTEVLLEAFEQWGPDFVSRLNGMFAFAIYDQKLNEIYLYRDRLGIKPLFYYKDEDNFVFASELKSIKKFLDFAGVKAINYSAINDFLYLGYTPSPNTIYKNVFHFPAGSYAKFDGSSLSISNFWNLEDQVKMSSDIITDEVEAKAALKQLVESSVKYRMISDVPIGTFLSGGIDSSLVTAVAAKTSPQKVKTFSIGFKESNFNEATHAKSVANYLDTDHHEFMVSYKEAMDLFDDVLKTYDQPFGDSSSIPTMLVSKLARQEVTVTLSGDGGDESYLGYGFYTWAKRLSNPLIRSTRYPISAILKRGNNRQKRASYLFNFTKERFKSHIFSQEQYAFPTAELDDLLLEDVKGQISLNENLKTKRNLSPQEEQALFDMKYYLKDDLLVKVDRASMKYSLESRVPLLDHRMIEFALNVDHRLKSKNGEMKYLLKQVLFDYVPAEMFNRPKWGFGMPIVDWLNGGLSHLIDDYLNESVVKSVGFVDPEKTSYLVKKYRSGTTYLYNRIWLLILLHKWKLEIYNS